MRKSRLAAARALLGITQKDFAEKAGMELSLYSRCEDFHEPHSNNSIGEKVKNKFAEYGVKFYGDENEGVIYYNFNNK